jgi:lysophospholipase L1-like esterase
MPTVVCSQPAARFKGLILLVGNSIFDNMFLNATARATWESGGKLLASQAVSGHTISQQLTAWNANKLKGRRECTVVVFEPGINDIIAGTAAATVLADQASFRANIRAANQDALIVQTVLTPARTYSGMSAGDKANWDTVVAAQRLISETNVLVLEVPEFDDGTGAMSATYDFGDGLHLNTLGSQLYATRGRALVDTWV